MTKKLSPTYDPKSVEPAVGQRWRRSGYANPDKLPGAKRRKPFSIAMPPPNVTGELHLGHALDITTQDILIRWKRMSGFAALWTPGTDHAGIATQILVERALKENNISRYEIGREVFLKHVWQWKEKYGQRIVDQIQRMGASCDWSREHFTMDSQLSKAVQAAFLQLYRDGLIYRGERVIHWCPDDRTGISDLEVDYREEQGALWFIRYPLASGDGSIIVSTTRPETMLGDTAVAVHPADERYSGRIGQRVRLPLSEREIPIVADRAVDQSFGTGAVKVTPAHDQTDFETGERHKLERLSVIGLDGRMTLEAGEFAGLTTTEARMAIVERLRALGLLEREEPYTHNVAYCSRSNTKIEPLISRQWFVKTRPLAARALAALKSGQTVVVPDRFTKVLTHWLENIRDWNISRQLWWGHRLPIWYCVACDTPVASVSEPTSACKQCGDRAFRQDEDTLDTWFSSGLWTFSTLGWPTKDAKDLKRFHPTSVLGTGWDILFFWVARMMMMSLYLRNEIPFKTIYLHGLVLNEQGKKMSKSKGTGVDPLPMADKYGTDALRLSLVVGTAPGLDFRMSEQKIAGQRNFCNKLWNISRYVVSQPTPPVKTIKAESLADRWILARLNETTRTVTRHLEKFQFGLAAEVLQEFIWKDFADWYVEIHKVEKNTAMLRRVLRQSLILLHPFAPFISEAVWRAVGEPELLMIEPWPKISSASGSAARGFSKFQRLVIGLRNIRLHGNANRPLTVGVSTGDPDLVSRLAGVTIARQSGQFVTIAGAKVSAPADVIQRFSDWRTREREQLTRYIAGKQKLASNEKAPAHIREQANNDLHTAEEQLAELG